MPTPADQPPAWVADAVFYQIFPDRFSRSHRILQPKNLEAWDTPPTVHGYKGGDLLGIVDRLDWLADLGVNAIYLNPIFRSASNHRYHTHDYYRVDPLLGGNVAFEEFVRACRSRDMRIVLDGVFNHASRGFLQFNDILESGSLSPWRDWFTIHSYPLNAYDERHPPNYDAWWGLHALPKFNTANPQVREYLMRVGEHWIEQGIDGWRLDVPLEIHTEGFWEEFRRRVRDQNPDAYIVGEIWHEAADWISRGDRFDGVMNYLLTGAVVSFAGVKRINWPVADGLDYSVRDIDAAGYAAAVAHLLEMYPESATKANLNLLGSHDTARLLTILGDDTDGVILAMLMIMTFPGAPCIYYGDEIGLTGGHDPECRAAFPWEHESEWNSRILDAVRSLIALRQSEPALRHGSYETLHATKGSLLHVFTRIDERQLLVAVNAGDRVATQHIPLLAGERWTRLWGDGALAAAADGVNISVAARSGAVWRKS